MAGIQPWMLQLIGEKISGQREVREYDDETNTCVAGKVSLVCSRWPVLPEERLRSGQARGFTCATEALPQARFDGLQRQERNDPKQPRWIFWSNAASPVLQVLGGSLLEVGVKVGVIFTTRHE